jgi:hypothetical protein
MNKSHLYAYFAGAIDADGFISIQRAHRRGGRRYERFTFVPTYYTAKIGFTGTAEPTVQELLREAFGGSVYKHTPKNAAHKPWHSWQATNKKAAFACKALIPYLQTKRRQAELAVELCHLCDQQWKEIKRTQKPPYRITQEMEQLRHAIWEQVTLLNDPRNRRVHVAGTDALEIRPATG